MSVPSLSKMIGVDAGQVEPGPRSALIRLSSDVISLAPESTHLRVEQRLGRDARRDVLAEVPDRHRLAGIRLRGG